MQVCLKTHYQKEMKWYLDSGYSKFRNLIPKDGGVMKFADGVKSNIVGIGNVGKNNSDLITNVMLVEGLTHNLLSISQFCDQDYKVAIEPSRSIVKDSTSNKIILTAKGQDNTYVFYLDELLDQNVKCLASFVDEKMDVV